MAHEIVRFDGGRKLCDDSGMKQQLHIKVSGDLEGDFAVTEERGKGEFVITRESSPPSLKEVRERSGARPATPEEFAVFEAEHGPFLPPDGES